MMKDIFELDIFGESLDADTVIYEESAGTEHGVTIPGGNSETPSAKPYDASSVAVPAKTTITADQYNSALANLKKSFKEAADVVEALENASVVTKDTDELQAEYTEAALEEALMESYLNGPIFEAASDDKKEDIKKAVKTIIKKIKQSRNENKKNPYNLREATWLARIIGSNKEIGRNAWKNVATFTAKKSKLNDAIASFTDTYKEDLGELFFNADCICDFDEISKDDNVNNADRQNLENASKNVGDAYILFIDSNKKKTPSTIKLRGLNAAMKRLK